MIHSFIQLSIWIGTLLIAQLSFCAEPVDGQDGMIVRYRQPQNDLIQTRRRAQEQSGQIPTEVKILNESEGLVKLRFATHTQSEIARQRLIQSDDVVHVANNFLYRPALFLQSRPVREFSQSGMLPYANLKKLLRSVPEVNLIFPPLVEGPDPFLSKDWAWNNIHMPTNWIPSFGFTPITVAVIDSGVDYRHEDLMGAMWHKPSNPLEVGYDFVHNSSKPYDVVKFDLEGCFKSLSCKLGGNVGEYLPNPGHGTHCAGHIGAVANNSIGIQGVGAQAKAQIMALKFFYDPGEEMAGMADDAAAIQAMDYAIENGARVINVSWGSRFDRVTAQFSELKQAFIRAQQAGVIVVVAAGNDGIDQDTVANPAYPAAFNLDNLIVVGAHDPDDHFAEFSSYGAKSVHISAPGVGIFSTMAGNRYGDQMAIYRDEKGGLMQMSWDGTSMAAPIVAGAVALVWSYYPYENYHQIRHRILSSVRKIPGLQGKVATGGALDVSAALGELPSHLP